MLLLQGEKSNRKQTAWIKFQSLLTIALAFTNLNIESASTSCMMMQPASVVVIGGTGTLGAAITRSLCSSEIHQVYSSYRSQSQKKASDIVTSITNMPMSSSMKRPKWFQFDLEESSKAKELDLPGFGQCSPFPHHVLLNCAGVCLHGHTREILERSLRVNTLGPIETSKSMIKYEDTDTFKKEKEKEKEEEKKAKEKEKKEEKNKNKKMKSVVNISSGDGELLYINSKIVKDLESILILEDLELYISNLCSSYDHSFEYAFGSSPMYALSKCLLNKATQLLESQHGSDELRFLSCCPGNFLSPITSDEELETAEENDLNIIVRDVLKVALNYERYPGGNFYRHGISIPF